MTNHSRYMALEDIADFNHEIFLLNLPGIILVGILAIIGAVGNAFVLYVYIWKIKPSNHRIFIIFLAVVDLGMSVIGMPSAIYEQIYPLMQYEKWTCKMRYTILYIMLNASFLILLVIAGERYRKVCKPLHRQMSITQAKIACVVVVIISVLAVLPEAEMFGLYTVETGIPGLAGTSCYIDEAYANTSYEIAQSAYSISFTFATFVVLSVLYYFVILKIRRQTKKMKSSRGINAEAMINATSPTASSEEHSGQESAVSTTSTLLSTSSNMDEESGKRRKMENRNIHGYMESTSSSTSKRITLMLFIITVAFLISHFPFIILETLTFFCREYVDHLGSMEYSIYNFFLWSLFINNVVNPIIYGFYDKRFIKEMKICYARVTSFRISSKRTDITVK